MTILVTRPSPEGRCLVNQLHALGRNAYHAPLINFIPGRDLTKVAQTLMQLNNGDLVFILSKKSVIYTDSFIRKLRLTWPTNVAYYAIGLSSGLALHRRSGMPVACPRHSEVSEELLMLPALQDLRGKKALILRGNGGRKLLGDTLRKRGAPVSYYECYQRCPVYYDGKEQSAFWQRVGIDTLVVTSGEMLQQLYTLVPEKFRSFWLLRCCLVVVSERLAILAQDLGWHTIRVADNAANVALIRALK